MAELRAKFADFKYRWTTEKSTATTMSTKEIWSYGLSEYGKGSAANIITAYFRTYLLTILGVSTDLIATFLLVETIFNYVKGPIISLLEDSTKTKMGRFLPYFVFAAPVMAIASMLFFFNPYDAVSSETGTMTWAYVTYLVYILAQGFTDTAWQGLTKCVTRDSQEKQKMYSIARALSVIGSMVASSTPVLYDVAPKVFNTQPQQTVLKVVFMILAVLSSGLGFIALLTAKNMRERIVIEKPESPFKNIGMVFKNKNVAIQQINQLSNIIGYEVGIATPFVFIYCYEAYSIQSVVWGCAGVAAWAGLILSKKLFKRFTAKQIIILYKAMLAFSFVVLFFVGYGPKWYFIGALIVMQIFGGFLEYISTVATTIFDTDIWDHYEWKYHIRNESTTGLVWSWVGIPIALANPLIYKWLFKVIQFQSGTEGQNIAQSDFTKNWLFWIWTLGNVITNVIGIIPYLLIKLDPEMMKKIRAELEERRLSKLGFTSEEANENLDDEQQNETDLPFDNTSDNIQDEPMTSEDSANDTYADTVQEVVPETVEDTAESDETKDDE